MRSKFAPFKIITTFAPANKQGQLPEWPNGADCNSAGLRLRWFESITAHAKKTFSQLEKRLFCFLTPKPIHIRKNAYLYARILRYDCKQSYTYYKVRL